jgi:peroxiredoxin
LRSEESRFRAAGARIVLVGMGTPAECNAFKRRFKVPFPMISDPGRELYRLFNLGRMSPLRIMSPSLFAKGVSALSRGHHLGVPQGDVLQLPGVFVIGADDRVCYAFAPSDPAGHPSIKDILKAVEDCPRAERSAR